MTALCVESTFPKTWYIFHLFSVLLFFFIEIVHISCSLYSWALFHFCRCCKEVFSFIIPSTQLLLVLYINFVPGHLAWLIIYSCLANDSCGFSQYRLCHLHLWGQTARLPSQPCHSLAVWAWTSHLASVCLSFLFCKMWYHSTSQGGFGWGPSELHIKRLRQWLTQVYVRFTSIPWSTWL